MHQLTRESDAHTITILIVDDDPASSYLKSRWLNRLGYRVIEATNGTDALAVAAVERPALVLLDVILPDINGSEVCERLKTTSTTKHIKVLQISALRRSASDRVRGVEAGADAYLVEPLEEEELTATVRALLKLAQQEQDNQQLIQKLSRTERQLLDATEAAHCGIWDWDIPTGKLEWFGEYEQLTGMLPDSFSAKIQAFVDLLHPDDRDRVWQKLQDLMARCETRYADEYRFVHPDGTVRWMNGTGRLYYDEHGQAVRMTGVVQDITEQKQAEAVLDLRARQQQALAALGMVVLRRRNFQTVCNLAVECIVRTLDVELCKVLELLPSGQEVLLRAGIGWQEGLVGRATVSTGMHSQAGYTLAADKAVIVEDMRTETRFSGPPLLHDHGVVSGMSCIILGAEDRPWGVLGAHTTSLRRFTKDDIAFLQGIANVLAGAIQREEAEADSIRLAAIVHSSEDAIISQDRDGVMTSWNGGAERLYGYSGLEAVGQSITLIIPSEHQDEEAHIRARILIGKQVERYDAVRRCKDGSLLDVSLTISPIKNDRGEIIGMSTIARDITERKRVEETLRASEARLEGLVTSAMDAVIAIDAEQRIILFNPAAERMFGCRSSDVVGSAIDRFIPETFRAAHRGHVQQFGQAGTTVRQMGALGTISGLRANGEEFPIEASISQMVAGGKPLYTVILRDITERKQAEETLRQSEERWQLAITGSTDGMWDWNIAGHTVFLSSRWKEMRGYREDELGVDETEWSTRIHPEDYARVMATVQAYLKKDLPEFHCEYRTCCKDGRYLWIVDRGIAIWDERGQAVRMVGSETDITLRKQAEEQLREKEERLRVLTTAMPQLVWACSSTGECIYQSPQWETVTGQSATDSLKLGWTEMIHPVDRVRTAEEWRTTVLQGTTYQTEYRLHIKDGTYRWYLARAEPLRDESGAIVQWIGTSTDIDEVKRTEEALRQSEERLRLAQQAAGVGAFDWNVQTGVNTWTAELEAIYGLQPGEFGNTQRDWEAFLHPDDRVMALQGVEEAFKSGLTTIREFRIVRPDGTKRWIAGRWQLFKDEFGQPLRLAGVHLDITVRKEAEVQVREGQERLRLATQAAAVGIWEWNVKTNQVRWDAQMFTIYQTAPTADGLVPYSTWSNAVVPDDLPEQERVLWETVRTCGSSSRQFRIRRYGDGAERSIEAVETVRTNDQGETEWLVGTNIDVTEHKQAEEALRESEERYRGTFANAAVGIGRVAFHNATWIDVNDALCLLVGYSREDMLRTPWPDMTYPADVDLDLVPFRRMAAGELDTYRVEKRFIHKHGHTVWARLTLSLMRTAAGAPDYEIAIVENIDERKRAEMALHDAQQRLQRWNVELEQAVNEKTAELQQSQERLRTLATELNLAEQRERKRLATELHDHLQQMLVVGKIAIGQGKRVAVGIPACERAFQRVDGILSDALTYSRTLVAELCPPVLHEHGLVAGLKWLAEYMKHRQEQTVTVIAPEDHELHLPEDQRVLLFQSIRELLINAAKHAGTGEATIVITERADQIQIEVRDRGQGFDLAAAAGTPHDGISSKFGLFSIQERMRAIGGSFEIQSSPGLGTTATLMLPLEKKPVGPLPASESVDKDAAPLALAHSRGPCIRVLLVDDHLMVRQGLRAILDAYAEIELVAEAGDGEEAVRLVGQWRPDVVVMDISMPRMNGIDATMQIKLRYPDTIVIGLSVNAAGENQEAMARAGAVRLITKEAAVEELYCAIQEAVKKGQRV